MGRGRTDERSARGFQGMGEGRQGQRPGHLPGYHIPLLIGFRARASRFALINALWWCRTRSISPPSIDL